MGQLFKDFMESRISERKFEEIKCHLDEHNFHPKLQDSDLSYPVYIMAINYDELTVKEEVVLNCIKKCLANIPVNLQS